MMGGFLPFFSGLVKTFIFHGCSREVRALRMKVNPIDTFFSESGVSNVHNFRFPFAGELVRLWCLGASGIRQGSSAFNPALTNSRVAMVYRVKVHC